MSKQVIVQYESADGTIQWALVEPSGRFERRASASNPEKHWQFEARDTRDGYMKHFALTDVRHWIEDVPQREAIMRNRREIPFQAA